VLQLKNGYIVSVRQIKENFKLPKEPMLRTEDQQRCMAQQNIDDSRRRQNLAYIDRQYQECFHRNEIVQVSGQMLC